MRDRESAAIALLTLAFLDEGLPEFEQVFGRLFGLARDEAGDFWEVIEGRTRGNLRLEDLLQSKDVILLMEPAGICYFLPAHLRALISDDLRVADAIYDCVLGVLTPPDLQNGANSSTTWDAIMELPGDQQLAIAEAVAIIDGRFDAEHDACELRRNLYWRMARSCVGQSLLAAKMVLWPLRMMCDEFAPSFRGQSRGLNALAFR